MLLIQNGRYRFYAVLHSSNCRLIHDVSMSILGLDLVNSLLLLKIMEARHFSKEYRIRNKMLESLCRQ